METELARNMKLLSSALTKELDSIADKAYELQQQAHALEARTQVRREDKGTQADVGTSSSVRYRLDRATRTAPFSFQPLTRKLNWKKLRAMPLDRLVAEGDGRPFLEVVAEIAQADLLTESTYNLTEGNLSMLVNICQFSMQYLQYLLEKERHERQLMEDDKIAVAAFSMQTMQAMGGFEGLHDGLVKLESEFMRVADTDMDSMFSQVRIQERTGARDTLGRIVDQAKQTLDVRAKQMGLLPASSGPPGTTGSVHGSQQPGPPPSSPPPPSQYL